MLSNMGKHEKLFLHKVFYQKNSVRSIFILQVRVAQNERERERERERPQVWDYTIIKKAWIICWHFTKIVRILIVK